MPLKRNILIHGNSRKQMHLKYVSLEMKSIAKGSCRLVQGKVFHC